MIPGIVEFDFLFSHAIQSFESGALTALMFGITFLGQPLFWMLVAAALYWHGKETEAFYLGTLTLFSSAIAGALKVFFAMPRPSPEIFNRLASDFYSTFAFPSGHATTAAAYWAYLSHYLKKYQAALLFVFVALVALSRIYLGVHFLSDVVAGIFIGALIGRGVQFLRREAKHRHFKPTKFRESLAIAGIVAAAWLALLFLENAPLSAALLGFFGGYFLSMEIGFKAEKVLGAGLVAKEVIGFAVLGLVFLLLPLAGSEKSILFLCYGFVGLWVSFFWPVLYQKLLKILQNKSS